MTRHAIYNEQGFMLFADDAYVEKAMARGELTQDDDGVYWVVAQPVRQLTPEEKRAWHLAKEREARSNR